MGLGMMYLQALRMHLVFLLAPYLDSCFGRKPEEEETTYAGILKKLDGKEQEKEECMICRETMVEEDKILILKCKHYWHKDCINEWMKFNKKCPKCMHYMAPDLS